MSIRHEIKQLIDDDQRTVATGSIGYQPWILTPQNHEYLEDLMANLSKGNEHYLATHKQVIGLMSMLIYKSLENKPMDNVAYIRRLLLSRKLKYYLNKYMLKNGYTFNEYINSRVILTSQPALKADDHSFPMFMAYFHFPITDLVAVVPTTMLDTYFPSVFSCHLYYFPIYSKERSPAQMDHEQVFLESSAKAHTRCCFEDKAEFKPTLEGGKFTLTPYGPPLPPKCQPFKKTYSASVVHGAIPYYIRSKEDEKIFVARDQTAWPSLFY